MSATQKQVLISGVIQLTIGVFCFIFGVVEKVSLPHSYGYYGTITSIPCLGIWMGLWIGLTGLIGIFAKLKKSMKSLIGVYLGFSVTSIVFAGVMIICYSLSLVIFYGSFYRRQNVYATYVMSILILILSIIEFGVGIWASVCCCIAFSGQQVQTAPGQVVYMQTQGGPTAAYVIVQGPDGTPVAVPAQTGGPMIDPSGTPVYNQTGAAVTSVPPHYNSATQQQPPEYQVKVPL